MGENQSSWRQILEGMALALILLLVFFLLVYAALDTWAHWGPNGPTDRWAAFPLYSLAFCGLVQSFYILPCYLFFIKKGFTLMAQGVILGAALILGANLLFFIFFWTH